MSWLCLIHFSPHSAISVKHITACLVWCLQWTPTPSTALTCGLFLKSYFFHLHKQQLNCLLICPPPLFCYWTVHLEWKVCLCVFIHHYAAYSALCVRDEEWLLVTTFSFARWAAAQISRDFSLRVETITASASLNLGNPPASDSADFHLHIYDAIPPHQPAIGKHTNIGGLAQKPVCCTPACCTVTEALGFGCQLKGWDYGSQILVAGGNFTFAKEEPPLWGRLLLDKNSLFSAMVAVHAVESCPLSTLPSLQTGQSCNLSTHKELKVINKAGATQELGKKQQNCRTAEWLRMERTSRPTWSSPAPAEPPQVGCPCLCAGRRSPRRRTNNLSGQHVPVLSPLHSTEVLSWCSGQC